MQNTTRSQAIILFSALYFAQGLPYGFFSLAVPTLMRQAGMSLKLISIAGWLMLPWALKFLWAAYLDNRSTPRRWLLTLQITSVIGVLLLAGVASQPSLWPLWLGMFVFSLVAASQDVVTDGLAVRTLSTRDLGMANGIQVGAYRVGMIMGGGVLLPVFAAGNGATMFAYMAGLLALTILPVLWLPASAAPVTGQQRSSSQLAVLWLRRLLMPGTLLVLGLIACYRLGDAMISTLLGPFLVDQGLSVTEIARLKGTIGSLASLGGALLGGMLAFRTRRRTLLLVAGLAQAASFLPYLLVANGVGGRELLFAATIAEGLIGTVATVALFTLMMDASEPEHAGTDYTLFACAVPVINAVGSFLGAAIGDQFGFANMFAIAIVLSVLGCLVLVRQLDRGQVSQRVAHAWGRAPGDATAT